MVSITDKVKASAALIAERSQDVSIDEESVTELANVLAEAHISSNISPASWREHELHPCHLTTNDLVNYIFVLDSLNFSFWNDDLTPYTVLYKGTLQKGYWGLCAALNRALDENIPIISPSYYSQVDKETLIHVFRPSDSSKPIPMLEERLEILHENGGILCSKYKGCFTNVLNQCNQSAIKLIQLVVAEFPSFNDSCHFGDEVVYFMKRAQILVADLWGCFSGSPPAQFDDISELTMFADYRVPQILASIGILSYTFELKNVLSSGKLLVHGSTQECEIRGCAIHAVEMVRQKIEEKVNESLPSVLIDFYLWDLAKETSETSENRALTHRTRTVFY
ncbi:hypothetical protein P9112_001876 [Eukaryota sp. TZLM1-RC]